MSNDWIHTRRGVTLVEGTLPKLARAIESAAAELKRFNDREEIQAKPPTGAEVAETIADEPDLDDCHLRGD